MQDRHCNEPVGRKVYLLLVFIVLLVTVILEACVGSENTLGDPVRVNTITNITQVSDSDYDNNVNGLITGNTFRSWLDDWKANRPTGISGKLVIFQTGTFSGAGYSGREYLKHDDNDDAGTFTYDVTSSIWAQALARSNGVSKTLNMVLDGVEMDALLKLYGVDPAKDMIVFAMGRGSAENAGGVGRGWYVFRYWGVTREHLAILNGDIANAIDDDSYFVATASVARGQGKVSVKDIRIDNTALQASLEEMFDVAKGNVPLSSIWDARSASEYNGDAGQTATSGSDYVAFEGHIRGAVNFEYTQLLDNTDYTGAGWGPSYRYLLKDAVNQVVTTATGYQAGNIIYTYSRRGNNAMVNMVAAGVVLGYPTKLYDGGWLEWGQLAWAANKDGSYNLAYSSPWRTDQASISDPITYNASSNVTALPPTDLVDENADSANLIIETDKAYKQVEESAGGGDVCTSPCGC